MVVARSSLSVLAAPDEGTRADAARLAAAADPGSEFGAAVRELFEGVARGHHLVVLRPDQEVTPAGAADLLGVTRQFVDRLLADGVLAFRRLPGSKHRRIRVGDVLALAEERQRRQQGSEVLRAACWASALPRVARPDRVFVDANELFPFSVMDLVLSLAEDLLVDFVWTDELLDEWERVIVREGRRSPETAQSVTEAVRRFFGSTRIGARLTGAWSAPSPAPTPTTRPTPPPALSGAQRSCSRATPVTSLSISLLATVSPFALQTPTWPACSAGGRPLSSRPCSAWQPRNEGPRCRHAMLPTASPGQVRPGWQRPSAAGWGARDCRTMAAVFSVVGRLVPDRPVMCCLRTLALQGKSTHNDGYANGRN